MDTFNSGDKEIGVLIGANYYHDIVTGEVIRGRLGPKATSSKLGCFLSGLTSTHEKENVYARVVTSFVVDVLPPKEDPSNDVQEIVDSLNQFCKHQASGLSTIEDDEKVKSKSFGIQDKEGKYKEN